MRITRYILLAAPLLLCGCDTAELIGRPAPDLDKTYSVTAEIDYGSSSAVADITRNAEGNWNVSFTEPAYLMGVELALADGKVSATLGDITVTADSSDVYTLMPDIITEVLDSLPDVAAENISESEGVFTLNTAYGNDRAVVTSDSSGGLLTLKCPAQQLSVRFSDQQDIAPLDTTETEETFEFIIEE